MNIQLTDIQRYARGECTQQESQDIREYLADNPDLIIYVLAERRKKAMQSLNLPQDNILPNLNNVKIANAIPLSQRKKVAETLIDYLEEKNEKKVLPDVTFGEADDIMSEEQLITTQKTTIMNTNINITAKELEAFHASATELMKQTDASHSTLHNMMTALLAACPELTPDEANQTCRSIIEGVTNFTEVFAQLQDSNAIENTNEILYTKMISGIEHLTPEQQANCMLNFMAFVRAIDAKNISNNLSTDDVNIENDFAKILDECQTIEGASITPEMLEEMHKQLKETLDSNSINTLGLPETEEMIRMMAGNDRGDIGEILTGEKSRFDTIAHVALAAYIAAQKGEFSLPTEISPMLLGVSIAAGMERQDIISKATKGIISWKNAFKLLKWIGAALLFGIFMWFAAKLAILITAASVLIAANLFGTAYPMLILGLLYGAYFGFKAIAWIYNSEFCAPVATVINKGYQKVADYFTSGKAVEDVKKSYNAFVNYLRIVWDAIKRAVSVITGPVVIVN